MVLRIAALLALCSISVWPSGASADSGSNRLGAINHIVVIYEENHSFDNLYGGWGGGNGPGNPPNSTQGSPAGSPPPRLRPNNANPTSPPPPAALPAAPSPPPG